MDFDDSRLGALELVDELSQVRSSIKISPRHLLADMALFGFLDELE